jgi:hypothetical protein
MPALKLVGEQAHGGGQAYATEPSNYTCMGFIG